METQVPLGRRMDRPGNALWGQGGDTQALPNASPTLPGRPTTHNEKEDFADGSFIISSSQVSYLSMAPSSTPWGPGSPPPQPQEPHILCHWGCFPDPFLVKISSSSSSSPFAFGCFHHLLSTSDAVRSCSKMASLFFNRWWTVPGHHIFSLALVFCRPWSSPEIPFTLASCWGPTLPFSGLS